LGSALNDLVIGLASAAIAAVLAHITNRIRKNVQRRQAMRRHPIDGVYASSYSDELQGVRRTVRDEVRIEQHGLEFTGFSRNLETRRVFQLKGRIVDERYLTGTYGGEHRADAASGVFFMALDLLETGRVEGLWAGFGAEAGTIISGKWSWRKLDTSILYLESPPLDPSRDLAASLLNDALGSGYVTPEELDELAKSPDGMVLLAKDSRDQLVGVGTAMVMAEETKAPLARKLADAGIRRANIIGSKVGLLKTAAVVPAARGRGIGLNLVYERLKRLKSLGCSTVLALAWVSGNEHTSLGVLRAAGFKRLGELPEYWREPDGQETFDCIKCGRPCVCTAVVLRRSLYDLNVHAEYDRSGRPLFFSPR
jgi:ribosomal protein S18 acetylase RimI-like enzyme